MLKKQNRLKTGYEFSKVRRFGGRFKSELFDLYYLEMNKTSNTQVGDISPIRFGIVISNKFSKSAVVRNRVRRVYREILRLNLDTIKNGFWVVIYPRLTSLAKGYVEINSEFNKVLSKIPLSR